MEEKRFCLEDGRRQARGAGARVTGMVLPAVVRAPGEELGGEEEWVEEESELGLLPPIEELGLELLSLRPGRGAGTGGLGGEGQVKQAIRPKYYTATTVQMEATTNGVHYCEALGSACGGELR